MIKSDRQLMRLTDSSYKIITNLVPGPCLLIFDGHETLKSLLLWSFLNRILSV
jgi:hypothetical protein